LKEAFVWLENFVSEEGSVKLRVEVTEESLEKGNYEFCTIQIREEETNHEITGRSRSTNTYNLAQDNLIRDFASLLGNERTADLKISVVSSDHMEEKTQVKVFCGHKVILSGMFRAVQFNYIRIFNDYLRGY